MISRGFWLLLELESRYKGGQRFLPTKIPESHQKKTIQAGVGLDGLCLVGFMVGRKALPTLISTRLLQR
jgi:hypothetical protein